MFNIRSFGQLTIVLNDYVLKNTIKANKSKYTKHTSSKTGHSFTKYKKITQNSKAFNIF